MVAGKGQPKSFGKHNNNNRSTTNSRKTYCGWCKKSNHNLNDCHFAPKCNKCHKKGHETHRCRSHITCDNCKKVGHYTNQCRLLKRSGNNNQRRSSPQRTNHNHNSNQNRSNNPKPKNPNQRSNNNNNRPNNNRNSNQQKKDVVCFNCGKTGHFRRDCRNTKTKNTNLPFPKTHRYPRNVTTLDDGTHTWSRQFIEIHRELVRLYEIQLDLRLARDENVSKLSFLNKDRINKYKFFLQRSGKFVEFETVTTNTEFVLLQQKNSLISYEIDELAKSIQSFEGDFVKQLELECLPPKINPGILHSFQLEPPQNNVGKLQFGLIKLTLLQEHLDILYCQGVQRIQDQAANKRSRLDAQAQAANIQASLGTLPVVVQGQRPPPINVQNSAPPSGNVPGSPKRVRTEQ